MLCERGLQDANAPGVRNRWRRLLHLQHVEGGQLLERGNLSVRNRCVVQQQPNVLERRVREERRGLTKG